MQNSLITYVVKTTFTTGLRRTSHLSKAYASSPATSKGGRFSSVSAGTPKLPLEPLRLSLLNEETWLQQKPTRQ
jgi:hypothetical protein